MSVDTAHADASQTNVNSFFEHGKSLLERFFPSFAAAPIE
jgi:hypothetical protein